MTISPRAAPGGSPDVIADAALNGPAADSRVLSWAIS
ncbi:hypothetical protein M2202_006570 [Bradyrhizobium japonicum]|uniref:Uncharacterized protein n=1 Tax=Bradyrhizobium japonicum TaxID=375 RepID=A0ABV2RUB9_BRAJP|nr:hypothetical protein [Bradyrhizobium japonicum]MCP1786758.1 hypothetical protein [Bradyrhizobium japonicum]MCP1808636.1 hypothetical protein [Bradyrhizobium japonicum]MCP1817563.1 hypothetical protein [Bradyrhizobium japonicum]MCP1870923.1 hypothetical protein [Bradyrhizobium japonicum]